MHGKHDVGGETPSSDRRVPQQRNITGESGRRRESTCADKPVRCDTEGPPERQVAANTGSVTPGGQERE